MAFKAILEIKEGKLVESLRAFLKNLLEKKYITALLVPLELPAKGRVAVTLVSDPGMLKHADPLAPVMMENAAQLVSEMTRISPSQRKIGVVLRPCELRALVELVKLKQASLENLVLIGIDCFGTYSVADYQDYCQKSAAPTEDYLKTDPDTDARLRKACQVCEYPAPINADILIGLIGLDLGKGVLIQDTRPDEGNTLKDLGLRDATEAELKKREAAMEALKSKRIEAGDKFFSQLQNEVVGLGNLLTTLAPCIGCHNCRVVCPICYCKECFFDSSTFEWEAGEYLTWAVKKGALRMPNDTLLYHLTRLNHMVASCVGCGMCQEACPNGIPVFAIFRRVGAQVQGYFNYVPGRSLEEEPPLTVFREDELDEIGKQ